MQVNILDAKNRLSELVRSVAEGKEVIIANRGKPVARLVKAGDEAGGRRPGLRDDEMRRLRAIVDEMHRIPDRPDAFYPLEWDEQGLPR